MSQIFTMPHYLSIVDGAPTQRGALNSPFIMGHINFQPNLYLYQKNSIGLIDFFSKNINAGDYCVMCYLYPMSKIQYVGKQSSQRLRGRPKVLDAHEVHLEQKISVAHTKFPFMTIHLKMPPNCQHSSTINRSPQCRSGWAHGVTVLGVLSGATSHQPPLPPHRVCNGLHSISSWFKVGGFRVACLVPSLDILFKGGGGRGGQLQSFYSQRRKAHKAQRGSVPGM